MTKAISLAIEQNKEEKKEYRWKVAISLFILFVLSAIANVPFSREIRRLRLESGEMLSAPFSDYAFTIGINIMIGAILIFIGLWVSEKSNLGAPVLARMFSKRPISELMNWKSFLSCITLAIVVAMILLGLFELQKFLHPLTALQERPSKLYYVLVSFVMGTNEEIIYRLGLMSLIVTAIQHLKKVDKPTKNMVLTGIIITALIFGMMHFQITSNFFELTPITIGATIIGNFITGTTFGWIFWKRGLLVAIVSHIAFDITFHVIGTPFG
tara:strand:- start:1394 stop:2200 length:807 start_codon:yes stop_codon:yes gene_type:complete